MRKLYLLLAGAALLCATDASATRSMKISGKCVYPSSSSTNFYVNSENRFTGLIHEITLTNTGDETLNPGDEDYTLSLYSREIKQSLILTTYALDEALAPGETKTFTVNWEFDFGPLNEAYIAKNKYDTSGRANDAFAVIENVSSEDTGFFGYFMNVYPYSIKMILTEDTYSGSELANTINFGFASNITTKKYRVKATGTEDVNVTGIDLPEGFTVSPTTFTVKGLKNSSSDYKTIEITLDPSTVSGLLSGPLTFNIEGADPKTYQLQGVVVAEGELFENFEAYSLNNKWITENYWSRTNSPSSLRVTGTNTYWYSQESSSLAKMISPRLRFEDGGKMQFDASRTSTYSSPILNIYWSTDRMSWVKLMSIDKSGTNGALAFPSKQEWTTYTIDNIPAGEGYIAFEGSYVALNDIYGGKVVNVLYDVMGNGFTVPAKATVNSKLVTEFSVKNLLSTEIPADGYTVSLYADGKLVDTAESVVIPGNGVGTFEMGYTPHKSGETKLEAVFSTVDMELKSSAVVNVNAESSTIELTIGDSKTTSSYAPLYTNYCNSQTQTVYSAEVLAKFGLQEGMVIEGVQYTGYDSNSSKTIFTVQRFALKSLEEDVKTISPSNPYTLDQEDYYFDSGEPIRLNFDGTGKDHTFLDYSFSKPYVYDGKSLLVQVSSETLTDNKNNYASSTFKFDNTYTKTSIYKKNDTYETYLSETFSDVTAGLPVMKLLIRQDPATISGVVKDSKGNLVPNAALTFKSTTEDILYTTVADEEGNFSVNIFHPEVNYTLLAEQDYYPATKLPYEIDFTEDNQHPVVEVIMDDFEKERQFTLTVHVTNDIDADLTDVPFTLVSNTFEETYPATETLLDEDGNATLSIYGGSHTITLSVAGLAPQSLTFGVNKDVELSFNLSEDIVNPYDIKVQTSHDAYTGVNTVVFTWNGYEPYDNETPAEKPRKSAGNPNEKFVVTLDGEEIGTTEAYTYTVEDVAYGSHTVGIQAVYVLSQSETTTASFEIADIYAKATVKVSTNDGKSVEGVEVVMASESTEDIYTLTTDEDGVAEFLSLPKGSYTVTVDVDTYNTWEAQIDLQDDEEINVRLIEGIVKPYNLKAVAEEQEDGTFTVTATWNIDEDEETESDSDTATERPAKAVSGMGNVVDYLVRLDGKTVTMTPETSHVITGVVPGTHKITVQAHYYTGYSDAVSTTINLVSGIGAVNGEGILVRGLNGAIAVDAPAGARICIYSASGMVVARTVSDGSQTRMEMPAGIYVVAVDSKTAKVTVR